VEDTPARSPSRCSTRTEPPSSAGRRRTRGLHAPECRHLHRRRRPGERPDATGNYRSGAGGARRRAQTVAFGDTVTGSLTVPGETRTYEFRANIGQSILLDVLSNDATAGFTLLDPLGEVVFSSQAGDQVLSLPASGTYTLVADAAGAATGAFSFRLVDQTAPPPVATNAGPAAGSTLPDPAPSGRPVPPIDFGALRDITTLGQLTYTGTTFNRRPRRCTPRCN
jgi:hypothetical protein